MTGFFDNYEDEGGAAFLSKEEKAALVKSGKTISITNVYAFTDTGQYPGPAFRITLDVDGEDRAVTFKRNSGVDSRDRMLAAMCDYFAEDGAVPVEVTLVKAGNAFLFKDANAAE